MLGTPYSSLFSTLASSKALAKLAVASVNEDTYGRVSKDVPTILRTYTQTIQVIEAFTMNLPPHWTDVEVEEGKEGSREVQDVETLVEGLKEGLGEMVEAFGGYTKELGLGMVEMEEARRIAARRS